MATIPTTIGNELSATDTYRTYVVASAVTTDCHGHEFSCANMSLNNDEIPLVPKDDYIDFGLAKPQFSHLIALPDFFVYH